VKPRSRDRIIAEIERVFRIAGAEDYDSGMAQCGKLVDWFQKHYHPMRSKQDLSALLDTMPEPSRLTMRFVLGAFHYAPQLFRYGVKQLSSHVEEEFPEIPRGRPGLDAFTKAQIVAKVGKWHIAGYTLDQAKKRAKAHFNVSESTVQRAWDDRSNRATVDFRSVLKYLANDTEDDALLDSMDKRIES
jgi:hypothetical protein